MILPDASAQSNLVSARLEHAERTVTLNVVNASLEEVLRTIARQAGLRVVYNQELMQPGTRVTVRLNSASAHEAFRRALETTSLRASIVDGNVVFSSGGAYREQGHVQGTIVGKVVHAKTRQPAVGVAVMVDGASQGATTDKDGAFRIVVPVGAHTVSVRSVGMIRQSRQVTVVEGESVILEFALDPSASVLDEVIVTGTVIATARKEIPTPITVIHGEELAKRGITRIEQLFRGEVPGLLMLDKGSAVFHAGISYGGIGASGQGVTSDVLVRGNSTLDGSTKTTLKTYIDGVELLDPAYLGTIDPANIERIEIVTGPQAATLYGSGALGGVMQIFTRKQGVAGMPEVEISLKYGVLQNDFSSGLTPSHNDALRVSGGVGSGFTYSGSLSHVYQGQWQPKLYSGRYGLSIGTALAKQHLITTGSFSQTYTTQGTFGGQFSQLRLLELMNSESNRANSYNRSQFYSDRRSLTSNQTLAFRMDYRPMPHWSHALTLGQSRNAFTLKPVAPDFADISDSLYQIRKSSGQRVTWGYNTTYRTSVARISSTFAGGVDGTMGERLDAEGCMVRPASSSLVGCTFFLANREPRVGIPLNDQSLGIFGRWQIGLFDQLYASLGLRFEQSPNYGRNIKFDVTPTQGLAYTLELGEMSLKLLGSYGRATRSPLEDQRRERQSSNPSLEVTPFVDQRENNELRPEYSRGPQGGFEVYWGNFGGITVNHYQQKITDLIERVSVDSFLNRRVDSGDEFWQSISQYVNAGTIRQIGWEGTGTLNLGRIAVGGTYSWMDSRVISVHPGGTWQWQLGQVLHFQPTHTGSWRIGYAHGGMDWTLRANYIGATTTNTLQSGLWWWKEVEGNRAPMYRDNRRFGVSTQIAAKIPGYTKYDLTGARRMSSRLTLAFHVINLTNSFASDWGGELNPTLGRQTTFGFSYRFGQ